VLVAMLATIGVTMTESEVLHAFVGRSLAPSLAIIEARLGAPLPPAFADDWHARLFAEFRRGVVTPTFLHAARTLGVDPARTAVVEDSVAASRPAPRPA
jgi:hypothetical protein